MTVRLRGFIAVLMVKVISIVSFSAVFARTVQASPAPQPGMPAIVTLSGAKAVPAKICHRMVTPGTVNICPLSSFSFGAVFATADGSALTATSVAAAWRLNDSSLPPQQPGRGLYRPPRASA